MTTRTEKLRDAIRAIHPASRLEPLAGDRLARLLAKYPALPTHLRELFTTVGVGEIGRGRYMIHALLSPRDVYDAEQANALTGIVLVGDDFAGTCEAYDTRQSPWQFGSVGSNGVFSASESRADFVEFLTEWYGSE